MVPRGRTFEPLNVTPGGAGGNGGVIKVEVPNGPLTIDSGAYASGGGSGPGGLIGKASAGVNGGDGPGLGIGLQQRLHSWLVDAMSSGKAVRTSPCGS